MTILDRRNRLFGRVHIFVIGFPILLVVTLLAIRSFTARSEHHVTVWVKAGPGNWWWLTPPPPDWYVGAVNEGDVERDSLGKVVAKVEDLRIFETGSPNKSLFLRVRLQVSFNPLSKKYQYKGQPVQISAPITLEIGKVLFSGNVIEFVDGKGEDSDNLFDTDGVVEKIVIARLSNVFAWEYDAIVVGEIMTDGAGTPIATILDKSQRPSLSAAVTVEKDRASFVSDPSIRDIIVTFRVHARRKGNSLVFREEQYLKVGKDFSAFFPSYDVIGAKITAIRDPESS